MTNEPQRTSAGRLLEVGIKTKLYAGLAIWQRVDIFEANISANKISLPQGKSYAEKEYHNGS